MEQYIRDNRILWSRKPGGRPRLKRYVSDMLSSTTGFSTVLEAPGNVEATKELGDVMGPKAFAFPKPSRLVALLIEQVTNPGDLILDSFAGSGTTGYAVLKLNAASASQVAAAPEGKGQPGLPGLASALAAAAPPRRFILVEMEPQIARGVTAERVRRVAQGYNDAKGEAVAGLGGSFRFCELGEALFDESGAIRETVSFADLARHVYFSETGEPLPQESVPVSPLLGVCRGVAIYLLYNGILGDASVNGGNVLTRAILAGLPPFAGPRVIYCAGCRLGEDRLQTERIIVRQTPYEVRVS